MPCGCAGATKFNNMIISGALTAPFFILRNEDKLKNCKGE